MADAGTFTASGSETTVNLTTSCKELLVKNTHASVSLKINVPQLHGSGEYDVLEAGESQPYKNVKGLIDKFIHINNASGESPTGQYAVTCT
jgi:hypothetical protein